MNSENILKVSLPSPDDALTLGDIHIIHGESIPLIFHVRSQVIFDVLPIVSDLIAHIRKTGSTTLANIYDLFSGQIDSVGIDQMMSELIWSNIISVNGAQIPEPDWNGSKAFSDFKPFNICLNITHRCNLGCIYCYGDGGSYGTPGQDMPFKVAKQAIEWMIGNLKVRKMKTAELVFFGGEPLLNTKLIEEIVPYAKRRGEEESLTINLGMTTNGTLLTEENSNYLKSIKLKPLISIDGGPQTQNRQRPFCNGEPSFDSVVEGVTNFKKATGVRLSARATFTDYNLKKTAMDLERIGFRTSFLSKASGKEGEHFLTEEGAQKLISAYEELFEYYYNSIADLKPDQHFPVNNSFIKMCQTITNRKMLSWACGAGRSYVAVAPSGKVYLCHRFVGNDDYCLGDVTTGVYNDDLYQQFISSIGKRGGDCAKCWIRLSCAGGCYQNNLESTGDINTSHKYDCVFNRTMTELSVRFYWRLSKQNPEMLKKICNIKPLPEHAQPCQEEKPAQS